MNVLLSASARSDLADAVRYYEAQQIGLGAQFIDELQAVLNRVAMFPRAWPAFSVRTRRCLMSRFPYGVIYEMRDETIRVVAVGHQHRGPQFWAARAR